MYDTTGKDCSDQAFLPFFLTLCSSSAYSLVLFAVLNTANRSSDIYVEIPDYLEILGDRKGDDQSAQTFLQIYIVFVVVPSSTSR